MTGSEYRLDGQMRESEEEDGISEGWSQASERNGERRVAGASSVKRKEREETGEVESRMVRMRTAEEEFKVVVKFKEGHKIQEVSLTALTANLKKSIGEVVMTKVMYDGSLFVKCKDVAQRDKAMRLVSVCKKDVCEVRMFGMHRKVRGVISGIPLGERLEELKKNIKGGKIEGIRRLQMVKDGVKVDSTSILLEFMDEVLPAKVMIDYMCYNVREYVPPPVRCYYCQRYGHIAKVCKGK